MAQECSDKIELYFKKMNILNDLQSNDCQTTKGKDFLKSITEMKQYKLTINEIVDKSLGFIKRIECV